MLPTAGVFLFVVRYFLHVDVSAISLKRGASCYPACTPGKGLCIEGHCFCRSPYGGATCADVVYKPEDARPADSAIQRPSGDVAFHRHATRTDGHHEIPGNSDDDADAGLDLFGVGDDAAEHTDGESEMSQQSSLHMETGELSSGQSSVQSSNNDFESPGDVSGDSSKEQMVLLDANPWPKPAMPPIAPPRTQSPSITTSGASQVAEKGERWASLFGSLWQPSPLDAKIPSVEIKQNSAKPSRDGGGHTSLRHHRRHHERPLLFASSEQPSVTVVAPAGGDPACVPWLAELRSADLYNLTRSEHGLDKVDMKSNRRLAYENRINSGTAGIMKTSFLQSLSHWYQGPTFEQGGLLFDRLDTSVDGMLTFEEYNWENVCGFRGLLLTALAARGKSWAQGFSFMDKNSDGDLSQEEFVDESIGSQFGLSSTAAVNIFTYIDSDASGYVNRTEFEMVGGLPKLRSQVAEKEPEQSVAFKQADTNKDGYLDDLEFWEHAEDMGGFRYRNAVSLVAHELDKNKDGKVEQAEYVNKCWTETGGACSENRCQRWRGPASCGMPGRNELVNTMSALGHTGTCICAPGYCAKNGGCIPEELHTSADVTLGPEAGRMLQKMERVTVDGILDKYFQGQSNADPAEAVVAVMLSIAVMMQLQLAFDRFPQLGVLVFTISVLAFYRVTVTCFRSFSVPGSIANEAQLMVLIFVYCAVTLSVTSLSRLWAPKHARIPIVCWFVVDDADEVGLDRHEELTVHAYRRLFTLVSVVCAFGMYEAPLDGVHSSRTKFMLVALYVCIVVLDNLLLKTELNSCSSRRFRHEFVICDVEQMPGRPKPVLQMARISCLAAWWNEMVLQRQLWQMRDIAGLTSRLDVNTEEQISSVSSMILDDTKRFSKFTTVRVPVQDSAMARQPQAPPGTNELFFLSGRHGARFGHHVNGRVVVMWEDTSIEFAWKSDSFIGSRNRSPWRTRESIDLDGSPDGSKESQVLRELPGVIVSTGNEQQTLQQKMLILTQAGASGLIIGQRGHGCLDADNFKNRPLPPDGDSQNAGNRKTVWTGTYHLRRFDIREQEFDTKVEISETRDVFNRYDFVNNWLGAEWKAFFNPFGTQSNTYVEDGVAINTFLIDSMDMQELKWSLEKRHQDSGYDTHAQERQLSAGRGDGASESGQATDDQPDIPHCKMYASFSCRLTPVEHVEKRTSKQMRSFGGFILKGPKDEKDTNGQFSRVVAHQHEILRNVVGEKHGASFFLYGIRNWVEELWFVKWHMYQYFHLGVSALALVFVLNMSFVMVRRIHDNDFGVWADFLVIGIMVMNGQNISTPIHWFPFKLKRMKELSLGTALTAIVLVGYHSLLMVIVCYYTLERMLG